MEELNKGKLKSVNEMLPHFLDFWPNFGNILHRKLPRNVVE
jgi:hypothetical protein